jgi:hypothetical protein
MSVVVFFDLGDTLAIPRLSDDGSLQGLAVLPFVREVLNKLKQTSIEREAAAPGGYLQHGN